MSRTVVKFDGEISIIPEGGMMVIRSHGTPIEIAVVADNAGPQLIDNPETIEDCEENAKRLWAYYRQESTGELMVHVATCETCTKRKTADCPMQEALFGTMESPALTEWEREERRAFIERIDRKMLGVTSLIPCSVHAEWKV